MDAPGDEDWRRTFRWRRFKNPLRRRVAGSTAASEPGCVCSSVLEPAPGSGVCTGVNPGGEDDVVVSSIEIDTEGREGSVCPTCPAGVTSKYGGASSAGMLLLLLIETRLSTESPATRASSKPAMFALSSPCLPPSESSLRSSSRSWLSLSSINPVLLSDDPELSRLRAGEGEGVSINRVVDNSAAGSRLVSVAEVSRE